MAAPPAAAAAALSSGGKVLFGSLCAGTFVLGVWQTQRYFEKETMVAAREEQRRMPPISSMTQALQQHAHGLEPYRRWQLKGSFHHQGEILVGPRGIPPGVLAKKAPQGVMGDGNTTGPQGYFVVTPFQITEEDATSTSTRTVFVNRGWIPKEFIDKTASTKGLWTRPDGSVEIMAVPTPLEEPKWIKPRHDFSKRPLRLLYYDKNALQVVMDQLHPPRDDEQHTVTEEEDALILLTEMRDDDDKESTTTTTNGSHKNNNNNKLTFPLLPPMDKVGEFKISPTIHAGYAVTWFALSSAGLVMTRKLLTRGRK